MRPARLPARPGKEGGSADSDGAGWRRCSFGRPWRCAASKGQGHLGLGNIAGPRAVGDAPQYASALGKNANCQVLVSLTPTSGEVPVMVRLRLFLPESWTSDPVRLDHAGVPDDHRACRTRPEIALAEIDRVRAAGMRFGRPKVFLAALALAATVMFR